MTGLEGEELTNFIGYYNFSVDYIIDTSYTELHEEVMVLLEEFKNHTDKNDNRYTSGA